MKTAITWLFVLGSAVGSAGADDRDLLEFPGPRPRVLLLIGSSGSMAGAAPDGSIPLPAAGDDDGRDADFVVRRYGSDVLEERLGSDFREILRSGSTLRRIKLALMEFLAEEPRADFAFSFLDHPEAGLRSPGAIYRIAGERQMLDGGRPNDPIFIGGPANDPRRPWRFRYGATGDEIFVADADPSGLNRGTGIDPRDGDTRLVSMLVDSSGGGPPRPWADISWAERIRKRLFVHPAYDAPRLPGPIRSGFEGTVSWAVVAAALGIDPSRPRWEGTLRTRVESELDAVSMGSTTVTVLERFEVFRTGRGWRAARPAECPGWSPPRATRLEYSRHFVLRDRADDGECGGMASSEGDDGPAVGFSRPDPVTGASASTVDRILGFLGSESDSLFFFPDRETVRILPANRRGFPPGMETISAEGARPIAAALEEALAYLEEDAVLEDPRSDCRRRSIILITDGGDQCGPSHDACSVITEGGSIPIDVIFVGPDTTPLPEDLRCVAERTGGTITGVTGIHQIVTALEGILRRTDDSAGRTTTLGTAQPFPGDRRAPVYVAQFTPRGNRSIWEGHLSAFSDIDAVGSKAALWDAGEILVRRWDWGDVAAPHPLGRSVDPRMMYFGDESGRRSQFAFPGNDREAFVLRRELGTRIFGRWPDSPEFESSRDRIRLRNTIDFIRGVAVGSDGNGGIVGLRAPELYGRCGGPSGTCQSGEVPAGIEKLGDIFHSRPVVMSRPSCPACFRTDILGYREFFEHHRLRRRVVFVGADDGALHAFDAGLWTENGGRDAGSGRELFSWIPRSVMGRFPALASGSTHQWTVDGTPTVADVVVASGGGLDDDNEWRTILVWGQRRGGRSYVCLDVTVPDPLDGEGRPSVGGTPAAIAADPTPDRDAACAHVPLPEGCISEWPSFRWEFTDTADEDHNGAPDLGDTWSRPSVGLVRIVRNGGLETRSVVFFGGGFDPQGFLGEGGEGSGNFFYGLDGATGVVLIKKKVDGMVPGDVQLLDLDADGFVEFAYFGTTAGTVYRVDLSKDGEPDPASGKIENWRPKPIFSAGIDQPFFMRPTLVPAFAGFDGDVPLAVLIGSGNRADLLQRNPVPHRFFVFLEPKTGILTEDELVPVEIDSSEIDRSLLGPIGSSGWYLDFDDATGGNPWEKVVTSATALGGYVVFSTFSPGRPAGSGADRCRSIRLSRTYVLRLTTGNPPPGRPRFQDEDETNLPPGRPGVLVDAEGNVRIVQASSDLDIREPVPSTPVEVTVIDWNEK